MRAGRLRNRVQIQTATETRDAHGGTVLAWATATTHWGDVQPLTGREFFQAQQVSSDVTHKITLRYYRSVLNPTQRLIHDGRVFNIRSVQEIDERRRTFTVMCAEVTERPVVDDGNFVVSNDEFTTVQAA
jgi:SPP1 family predicted phage head-tail adaptor